MLILGIDTSSQYGVAALCKNKDVLASVSVNVCPTHSERLMPSIEFLLESNGSNIKDLDAVAIGIGPGSFTGLRVGVCAAKGMAFALNIPLIPVSSLEALAHNAILSPINICPIAEAYRGQVYTALFRSTNNNLNRLEQDSVLDLKDIPNFIKSEKTVFLGSALLEHTDYLSELLGDNFVAAPRLLWKIRGENISLIGTKAFIEGKTSTPDELDIQYIRGVSIGGDDKFITY